MEKEPLQPIKQNVENREITSELKESYLDYAMSVIVARALPDVRDGLKPVHRRILWTMWDAGLTSGAKFRKSANVIGEVLGKYHPHGDTAVYDALVRMVQDFSLRYPLIQGQGNFGCFTKDTKVKLTDGRNLSFENLVKEYEQGKRNYTYTINSNGLISIAEIKKPRLTIKNAGLVRVVLDNGEEIRCTPNHRFMLRDGSYKEARNLGSGESLMPLYHRFSTKMVLHELNKNHKIVKVEKLAEREDVYDLTIDKSHNFALAAGVFVHNSIDGDSAAAYRYTEARLSKIAEELLFDIEKESVDWQPNYDGSRKEPKVMPAKLPNLLLNGAMGIAVGMATNIPPHNLTEVVDATIHLMDNPDATSHDLTKFVQGPDFPTGGIIYDKKGVAETYTTGRGSVTTRAAAEMKEKKSGGKEQFIIEITEIPYQVNKSDLITKMAELVTDKKIEGIRDIRDESDREGLRIIIELKSDASPQKILNQLYKLTELQKDFHLNMIALVDGIQPQLLSLKEIIHYYIEHRKNIVRRRAEFDLKKAEERAHILIGLAKALDEIDAVIATIKKSADREDAHKNLVKKFKLSDIQVAAILEMRLQTLAALEKQKIENELKEKKKLIAELQFLLKTPPKILAVIKEELEELKKKYGGERRTKVMAGGLKEFKQEDLIPKEETIITFSKSGYIKRLPPTTFKSQQRGGKGVIGSEVAEEDFLTHFIGAVTHDNILFFTDKGRVFQTKVYEIPQASRTSKGKPIHNFLQIPTQENITAIITYPDEFKDENSLMMITRNGNIKKTSLKEFANVRRNGIIAISLKKDDLLRGVELVKTKDEVVITTQFGQAIRFKESQIRPMGRTAAGVRAIKLKKGDLTASMDVIDSQKTKDKDLKLLAVMANGFGKRTPLSQYKIQNRGGSGIKTAKITAKTGSLVSAHLIDQQEEILALTAKGQIIRTKLEQIRVANRDTQGVKIMTLDSGDKLIGVICL